MKNHQNIQNDFVENSSAIFLDSQLLSFNNLSKDKDKWNFFNEARKNRRTKTMISCLEMCFGENITEQKKIADLLNYLFSEIGEYCGLGLVQPFIDQPSDEQSLYKKTFSLRPVSFFECRNYFKNLNISKIFGPLEILAWALRDSKNIFVEALCYLINAFLYEGESLNYLKQKFVIAIFKKGGSRNPNNYRPVSITSAVTIGFEKVTGE